MELPNGPLLPSPTQYDIDDSLSYYEWWFARLYDRYFNRTLTIPMLREWLLEVCALRS